LIRCLPCWHQDIGKISCAAKGARRQKSSLLAGSQLLCFGEYILYKGANSYNINSVDTIEIFYNIRTDIEKLEYVSCITKIILDVTTENQNSYKILQLYLNTLYTISEIEKNLDLVLSVFKIKLLCILGFMPNIYECTNCKNPLENEMKYFSFKDNGLKCSLCGKNDKGAVELNQSTVKALKYIVLCPAKKLFSFNVSENVLNELVLISKILINEKLEKEYKNPKKFA